MSERTREAFFDLQRALKAVGEAGAEDHVELPDDPTGDALKRLGSRLRTSTTADVATRVGPLLTCSLRAWLKRVGRPRALVSVTRGWRFDPDAAGGWCVSVVNRSPSRALRVEKVWLEAGHKTDAEPLDDLSRKLPTTLNPRQAWHGFVPDQDGLMKGVDNPFRAGRASGPRWKGRSRSEGDPPASPLPHDTLEDQPRRLA